MSNKKLIIVSANQRLNELFTKAYYSSNTDAILDESSVVHLVTEVLDKSAVADVGDAIKKSNDELKKVEDYIKALSADGFDDSKLDFTRDYINSLKDALTSAQGELAGVSFETGAISSFMGQQLSLPQITQAAIAIQTKAQDFLVAFSDAIDNLVRVIGPMIKDDNFKEVPLEDIAGQGGIPTLDKLKDGLAKSMKKSFGGGFFKKAASFFGKALAGPQKRILDTIPELPPNLLAQEVADAVMSTPFSAFEKSKLNVAPPDTGAISAAAQDAKKETEEAEKAEKSGEAPAPEGGGAKETSKGEAPPASEDEAKKAQSEAETEIKAAVQDIASDRNQSPKVASLKAIDSWASSLSASSQKDLNASNRLKDLKDVVGMALDDAAKAVESEVAAAVQAWRGDHEEQLIKNKRFAKKNFQSLEDLVPKLAAAMMKTKNESSRTLTKETVRKAVYTYLNRKFLRQSDSILSESKASYEEQDMICYRMNKLAGLDR